MFRERFSSYLPNWELGWGRGGGGWGICMQDQSNMGELDVSFSFAFVCVVMGYEERGFFFFSFRV